MYFPLPSKISALVVLLLASSSGPAQTVVRTYDGQAGAQPTGALTLQGYVGEEHAFTGSLQLVAAGGGESRAESTLWFVRPLMRLLLLAALLA